MLYSEIFRSLAGEGYYTGYPSIWLRTYLCNLECKGFSQPDPMDESTYHEVGKDVDLINIKNITELPVFKYGCDSAYSVAKKFRHLQHDKSYEDIISEFEELLPIPGVWHNRDYNFHMVFTGGEPLLRRTQKDLVELLKIWDSKDCFNRPQYISFETNGTQKITPELAEMLNKPWIKEVLINFSPKLQSVSGEVNKKAIKPEIIKHNIEVLENSKYIMKFVLNSDERAWKELDDVVSQIGLGRSDVWIMPVGSLIEDQEVTAGDVADLAVSKGYKVSARVHTYLWGNAIGK